MKYVKMLGLTAVAAMALTAFLGAGSASATVLCKTKVTEGCAAAGWSYGVNTTIHATQEKGTTAVLEAGSTTLDTCTTSTVHGFVEKAGDTNSTVSGDIKTLTWGEPGTTPCTNTTDTLKIGGLEVHWISGTDNGTLTATGETEVTINTIFGSCVYGSGKALDLGTITGGSPATIDIHASVPKISGNFACPSTGTWTASYEVTEPTPLYVATS